ncbi:hypothetical protein [Aquimarina sp. 2201CG5-10]|uniref:hypothetical protein n=1 Tax=Aquimarina callyspongiae TaxID=3098150 RepID=UPI002AB5A4FC|nr:hypothetical protein [Aquimarina sp. 2201CG5-10]MDY8136788.1 hypothetical protein [Aquimarina sp. 2201CG5-10]
MMINEQIQHIEKEQIKFLHFPKREVLDSKRDKKDRYRKLVRGLSLGNLEHLKVKIIFADDKGSKEVETTIWGITDKSVILKQSTIIPLERIINIS